MIQVLLIVHLILAIALVGIILVQRSEGGALGIGGGNMGGLMTTRGSASLLTRATAIIAACFICTSLLLAIWSSATRAPSSVLDRAATPAPVEQPIESALPPQPAVPVER